MLYGLNREWRKDGVVVTLTGLIVRACAIALRRAPGAQRPSRCRPGRDRAGAGGEHRRGRVAGRRPDRAGGAQRRQAVAEGAGEPCCTSRWPRRARIACAIEDVEGGTFTVTSLDHTVVDAFTPIINPPQAAILGVGRVRDVAAFEGSEVVKRQVTTLSLTFDHRVTDGTPGGALPGAHGRTAAASVSADVAAIAGCGLDAAAATRPP